MITWTRSKIVIGSALVALTLIGCATSGTTTVPVQAPLPPLPADLKVCFDNTVPAPKQGPLTKGKAIELIASLKHSEAEKTACGKRIIAFYESLL